MLSLFAGGEKDILTLLMIGNWILMYVLFNPGLILSMCLCWCVIGLKEKSYNEHIVSTVNNVVEKLLKSKA